MHSCALCCIHLNFIAFYVDAFLICCMLTHLFALQRIHVCCILVRCINMHSYALHLLHHNAFSIWCIYVHFYASIIRCISILCCIIMHLEHVIHSCALPCIYTHSSACTCVAFWCILTMMHSCALPYVCILNVMHLRELLCMQMRCILMHSNYDAFMCINSYSSSRRRNFPTWNMRHARRW